MKRISILGSTGSIGTSTLKVVEEWPDRFRIVALAAGSNSDLLLEQVRRFKPELVSVSDPAAAERIRREFPAPGLRVLSGGAGLRAVAVEADADMVVSALVGAIGLEPTLAALEAGRDVALANKETLVVAGGLMTAAAARTGARLMPLDSEHAALHQILDGRPREHVSRLVLTASGGPFRKASAAELERVTVEQALKHPTWEMGAKITVDSATLANKALEVIEACWLFGIDPSRIDVVVHPQSIVHALVEFVDGTFLAQLGVTDMRAPIQYALSYPDRWPMSLDRLPPTKLGTLVFEPPDLDRFPCLRLGMAAAAAGGSAPAVFNAANEVANASFRQRRLGFTGIATVVGETMSALPAATIKELAEVLDIDRRARELATRLVEERSA